MKGLLVCYGNISVWTFNSGFIWDVVLFYECAHGLPLVVVFLEFN